MLRLGKITQSDLDRLKIEPIISLIADLVGDVQICISGKALPQGNYADLHRLPHGGANPEFGVCSKTGLRPDCKYAVYSKSDH